MTLKYITLFLFSFSLTAPAYAKQVACPPANDVIKVQFNFAAFDKVDGLWTLINPINYQLLCQ